MRPSLFLLMLSLTLRRWSHRIGVQAFVQLRDFRSSTALFEKSNRKKFKISDNINEDSAEKLAKAFDDLARKEGFDSSTAYYADEASFEDDDMEEDLFLDDEDEDEDEDDFLDFGEGPDDMDARIAAAKRDMDRGKISVPKELDDFAESLSVTDLTELGFKPERNPFGRDETPRAESFKLITNSMACSACGSDFQCTDEKRPGYIPPEKFDVQIKLGKIEEVQRLKEAQDSDEWSPEDEVEWLLQTSGPDSDGKDDITDADIESMAEEMGLDLIELSRKKTICKRCHGLQNFGKVDNDLRPGYTKEPTLSQEKFRELLRPIRDKPAVIIALVDLFDFAGSVLPELDEIAGDNPVILAANKVDLLPEKMGKLRAENWVRRELEYMGVKSLANIGGAVRLVSSKTGLGIPSLLEKARSLAEEIDGDIYVVGAANAGKSTLLNRMLRPPSSEDEPRKKRAGNINARKGVITTSPLPGTTLKFIKIDLGQGRSLYDTPGLLIQGSLTQLLTPEELKIAVPSKKVEPVTFRLNPGKCALIGGLAKIELAEDCKPFMFTFYIANEIKIHLTDSARAREVLEKHVGEMLTPPLPPGRERLEELGEWDDHNVQIQGDGWKEASADIALTGLGWVAVTGPGTAKVKISVPKGIGVSVRPPLMPYDVWESASKYTGAHATRKVSKKKSGKGKKGVGRR